MFVFFALCWIVILDKETKGRGMKTIILFQNKSKGVMQLHGKIYVNTC